MYRDAKTVEAALREKGVRVELDERDEKPERLYLPGITVGNKELQAVYGDGYTSSAVRVLADKGDCEC